MNTAKKKRLEKNGWKNGSAAEFLNLSSNTMMLEFAKHCGARKLSKIKSLTSAIIYLNSHPLQKKNAVVLAKKFKFTEKQTAHMVGMSSRLYRLAPPTAVLHFPAVENVMRLSEVYELGMMVFSGNARSFHTWLNSHVGALSDFKPIQVLESGIGIGIVRDLLWRMEYSLFA